MPHQVHQRKFGRKGNLRRGMLRNLTTSVLRYERVKTTEAKAKEIRGFVDRMINLGKDGSLDARRRATAWIDEPIIVEKVFADLAKRYPDRTSGYLRMTRLARRVGDSSPLMLVELMPGVDETKAAADAEAKPRRRRLPFRRGASEATAGEEKPAAQAAKKTAAKKTTTRKKTTASAASSKED
ncbi:MAG TPA: 50S ribosomal protein L17 [Candidatus Limnocylindria bacterium]|nr:50S ribosomal protein L17 [Candidatus Limnocylindria bacterium]